MLDWNKEPKPVAGPHYNGLASRVFGFKTQIDRTIPDDTSILSNRGCKQPVGDRLLRGNTVRGCDRMDLGTTITHDLQRNSTKLSPTSRKHCKD